MVWGSPLILAATFILRKLAGNGVPFAATYWLATAALILAGFFVTKTGKLEKLLRRSLAAALLLSSSLHFGLCDGMMHAQLIASQVVQNAPSVLVKAFTGQLRFVRS